MNGAEALIRTLAAGGLETVFANPGSSEMYLVDALVREPGLNCVLCLHENVVTGAADGYGRMADKPAATLLHLGPGLANGLSNIHNSSRAHAPMINVVGDHATYHRQYPAPLTTDIRRIAEPFSHAVDSIETIGDVGPAAARTVTAALAPPGRIVTLIAPADMTWLEGAEPAGVPPAPAPARVPDSAIEAAAREIRSGDLVLLLLAARALREAPLAVAAAIAAAFPNVQVLAPNSNGRIARGQGRYPLEKLPYPVEQAVPRLKGFASAILVQAPDPVAFFAYPGTPSKLLPDECQRMTLAGLEQDAPDALERLAEALGVSTQRSDFARPLPPAPPKGQPLTPDNIAKVIAASLPEGAVVVDESVSVGRGIFAATMDAPAHDWLHVTGGAIGNGLPMAVGAAVACPGRRVIAIEGDGSALYTNQALWTMAREKLDVTVIILRNNTYAILHGEYAKIVGRNATGAAAPLLDLDKPAIDWAGLAAAFGVDAVAVADTDAFGAAILAANRSEGPQLIVVEVA